MTEKRWWSLLPGHFVETWRQYTCGNLLEYCVIFIWRCFGMFRSWLTWWIFCFKLNRCFNMFLYMIPILYERILPKPAGVHEIDPRRVERYEETGSSGCNFARGPRPTCCCGCRKPGFPASCSHFCIFLWIRHKSKSTLLPEDSAILVFALLGCIAQQEAQVYFSRFVSSWRWISRFFFVKFLLSEAIGVTCRPNGLGTQPWFLQLKLSQR